ncbi:GNAT family N-acetyltransferase [Pelistega ratti]|uniref:GNAT family N-acetyltransferase n=1 Tax=Pelistega ratti TaxID=2652177 RepID=UPI0013590DEC|nr:GNAT family N-acetyltransferase [Pelistega ratti]
MTIHHDTQKHLFFTEVDGHTAYIHYEPQGDNTLNILHTVVPEAIGGRGIAGKITEFMLNTAKENNYKIIPSCSYTESYLKRHPEYQDLVAK